MLLNNIIDSSVIKIIHSEGEVLLISKEGLEMLLSQSAPQSQKVRCYQCLMYVEPSQMRDHVGRHILKAMRQVHEEIKGNPVSHTLI